MSVFLRNVILDIYTYLCNVFAYFENFMRYIIYKIHILYNNVRCERVARGCTRMCADVREHTCARPPRCIFKYTFFNKSGKMTFSYGIIKVE